MRWARLSPASGRVSARAVASPYQAERWPRSPVDRAGGRGWSGLAAIGAMVAAALLGNWVGIRLADAGPHSRAGAEHIGESAVASPAAAAAPAAPDEAAPETPAEAEVEAEPLPVAPVVVADPADWWSDAALQARAAAAIPPRIGRVAVAARHLRSGASAAVNAHLVMPPASVYKLGVLVEAFRQIESGRLTPDEQLLLTRDDWFWGAGVLQARIGGRVSVGEALRLMIGLSDNTAALALLRRVGPEAVNVTYQRHGLANTWINPPYRSDTTTAAETATLLALLASGQVVESETTQQMLDLLAEDQPQGWIRAGLPPGTVVAHKYGQLTGVRNDAAIVYAPGGPYVLVVLADRLVNEAAGEAAISRIAREVHAYFSGQ